MKYDYYIDHERVKQSSERLRKAFKLEEIDHPPVIEFSAGNLGYTILERVSDCDKMLRHQLDGISKTMRGQTDYCPFLEPWFAVPALVEPLGVGIRWFENDWPAAERPLITDNPSDVYKLEIPKPFTTPLWKKIKEAIEHFQLCTNGDIPVSVTDPQDPLSMATMIWDTGALMTAMYTDPKEVHYLLDLLTEHFIVYTDAQLKIIEHKAFPGHSFPLGIEGNGISMSCDNIIMLSPEIFEEYCLPRYAKISEHFNGLYLHSCGNYRHLVSSILKIPRLRGVNYHSSPTEMDPYEVRPKLNGKVSVWTDPSIPEIGFGGIARPFKELYADYFIPANMCTGGRGLILAGQSRSFGYGKSDEAMTQTERYEWIVAETLKHMRRNA